MHKLSKQKLLAVLLLVLAQVLALRLFQAHKKSVQALLLVLL